jgi:hypothetical protein
MENHSGVEIELTIKIGEKLAGVTRVKADRRVASSNV